MEINSEYYHSGLVQVQQQLMSPEKRHSSEILKNNEQFIVEEFFDFSNEDDNDNVILSDSGDAVFDAGANGNSTESSSVTTVVGVAGNQNFTDGNNFSNDLCLPYDDLAEFEWLSNIEEESFSSEDLQKLHLISGLNARKDETLFETRAMCQPNFNNNNSSTIFRPEVPVPGKARSKRSRAAPCNWTSRLLVLTPPTSSESESTNVVPPVFSTTGKKTVKATLAKSGLDQSHWSTDGRKCLHCATDKTPQWRTGPMGPKTLCNACGVRYKSGRLVPEYRPAASPTFMLTKHSNSHRKVMELRRQKEMVIPHQHDHHHNQHIQFLHHQGMMYDVPNDNEHSQHGFRVPSFQ